MARPREFDMNGFLDEAMAIFWAKGFSNTSMAEIYAATGVGPGSVYGVIKDKDTLFQKVFDRYAEAFRSTMSSELSGLAALTSWLTIQVQFLSQDPSRKGCLIANTIMERYAHSEVTQKMAHERLQEIRAYFLRQIEAGQRSGEIQEATTSAVAADALLGSIMGIMALARGGAPKQTLERIGLSALHALKAAPAPLRRSFRTKRGKK